MRSKAIIAVLVGAFAFMCAGWGFAQSYSVRELTNVSGSHMNNMGQVVVTDGTKRYIWDDGTLTQILSLATAARINNAAGVSGAVIVAPDAHPAYREAGSTVDLDPQSTYESGYAASLNDAHVAVGEWHQTALSLANAAIWSGGGRTDVTDTGWQQAWFADVSNSGLAVGTAVIDDGLSWVACIGWDGSLQYLSGVADSTCFSRAVNDFDQVVMDTERPDNGAIWENGTLTDLSTFGFGGNYPKGINNLGQVVGHVRVDAQWTSHGYLWEPGALTDLNDLLPSGSNLVVESARDINDAGQILARADRNGINVWILMTPPGIRGLGPSPGRAGEANTLKAIQATNNGSVKFYYGSQSGSTSVSGCAGLTVDVANASSVTATADGSGVATTSLTISSNESGHEFRFYAVDMTTCTKSNLGRHLWP